MTVASPVFSAAPTPPMRLGSRDSTWRLWLLIIAVLLFLVVSPFIYLIATSFTAEGAGGFTFENYAKAYGRERYVQALINSLQLGTAAALLAGVFAVQGDQILAIPTLVRQLPEPIKKIIGDLSHEHRVLVGLDLRPA